MSGKKSGAFTMLLALSLSVSAQETINGKFAGWADIGPTGRLMSFAPDGAANPALTKALQHELEQVTFLPARRDSGPAAIRTHLSGDYRLEPNGDEYVLQVARVNAGPKVLQTDLPKPPLRLMTMNESGWARVVFRVGADGKAHDVMVEAAKGPPEIQRNVRDAIMRWRFEPETMDGVPVETLLRKDFTFAKGEASVALPICPPDNGGRVLAPEQAACETLDTRLRLRGTGRAIQVP